MKKQILYTLILLLSSIGMRAQETDVIESAVEGQVIVHLNSGSSIVGYVNEWVIDEYIDLKTSWNDHFVLPMDKVEKVIPVLDNNFSGNFPYVFKETGIYYSAKAQFITGNDGPRANSVNGVGASFSAGYRFNRWNSVGLGVGYDRFIWKSGENMIPIFLEYASYFSAKNTSLYFNGQIGYSLAFSDDQYLLQEAEGGRMIYPSLGIRFGKFETKYTLDLGYKFQKATLTYGNQWTTDRSEQRIQYKRLCLRFGILM